MSTLVTNGARRLAAACALLVLCAGPVLAAGAPADRSKPPALAPLKRSVPPPPRACC